ncbi:MAG: type II/IV secretion system ATPase subunit [Nanoarchaeota archaeon]
MLFRKKEGEEKKVIPKQTQVSEFKINLKQPLFDLPDVEDRRQLNVRYPLIEPFAYAHIYWDNKNNELVYNVDEPVLNSDERRVLGILEKGIEELINISFIAIKSSDVVIKYLEDNVKVLLNEYRIKVSKTTLLKLMYFIYRNFVGLNEVEPLMRDYYIEDIECNGVNSPVYLVHRKYRNLRTNINFMDMKKLTSFVEKLAQKCGKYISYANPLLDGALPDGSRINATYTQDITSKGPTFTVRKFTKDPWSPVKLMQFRTVSPEVLAYLWLLIEYESNILVVGGTGSGKTSFLNSLAFFIPPQSRIVSIEDTRELNLLHINWLPSVARQGVGLTTREGTKHGEVTLFDLLKESFRQRPDYVIVGEIRGKEAYVLFQGMSSGHPSLGTMHAEDLYTMIRRLETRPINLSPALVNSLDCVCVMANVKEGGREVRKVKNIIEIENIGEKLGDETVNEPFIWDPRTNRFYFKSRGKSYLAMDSRIFDKIIRRFGVTRERLLDEFRKRTLLLMKMYDSKISGYKQVHDIITAYHKTPDLVLNKFGIK